MRKSVYEENYNKMVRLGIIKPDGDLNFEEYKKIESKPFMDLHLDHLLHKSKPGEIVISMAHNYKQNGDIMADPDMEIGIYPEMRMVEALTYQQDGLGIYQQVYLEDGRFYPILKKELNVFLASWLRNLEKQGFSCA